MKTFGILLYYRFRSTSTNSFGNDNVPPPNIKIIFKLELQAAIAPNIEQHYRN